MGEQAWNGLLLRTPQCFSMCAFTEVTCMHFYNVKYKTNVYFCMNMNIKISSFSAVNIVSEVK